MTWRNNTSECNKRSIGSAIPHSSRTAAYALKTTATIKNISSCWGLGLPLLIFESIINQFIYYQIIILVPPSLITILLRAPLRLSSLSLSLLPNTPGQRNLIHPTSSSFWMLRTILAVLVSLQFLQGLFYWWLCSLLTVKREGSSLIYGEWDNSEELHISAY